MRKVRKAVIPAAGLGTRFLPATKTIPKEMFPIIDIPLIQYIVEEAEDAGIEDILIIIGENKTAIRKHFIRNPELAELLRDRNNTALQTIEKLDKRTNVHFAIQKEPLGLGHAILCARSYIGQEPFAVLLGDTICIEPTAGIKPLLDVYQEKQSSIIAIRPVDSSEIHKYGVVIGNFVQDRLLSVDRLVEKPKVTPPSNLAIIGRYVLEPEIFEILAKISPGSGNEIQLTDALQILAQNQDMYAFICDGTVCDAGDKLGYLQAVVQLALQDPNLRVPFASFLRERKDDIDEISMNA